MAVAALPAWCRWPWPLPVALAWWPAGKGCSGRMQRLGEEAAGHGHCRANLLPARGPEPWPAPRPTVSLDPMDSCGDGVLDAAVWVPARAVHSARAVPSARAQCKQDGMWAARAGSPQSCPMWTGLMWGLREAESAPAPGKSPAVRGTSCSIAESRRCHQHLLWSQHLLQSHLSLLQTQSAQSPVPVSA